MLTWTFMEFRGFHKMQISRVGTRSVIHGWSAKSRFSKLVQIQREFLTGENIWSLIWWCLCYCNIYWRSSGGEKKTKNSGTRKTKAGKGATNLKYW